MSICQIHNRQITKWHLVDVNESSQKAIKKETKKICFEQLVENIIQSLVNYVDTHMDISMVIDNVLIENQPHHKNGMMKTVSVVIYTFFSMMKMQQGNICNVNFVSANNKYKCVKMNVIEDAKTLCKDYRGRKILSKQLMTKYIEDYCQNAELAQYYFSHKKQDDLADCALLGIHFIENSSV